VPFNVIVVTLRECWVPQAWCRSIWDRTSNSWVKLWVEWCRYGT